MTKSRFRRQCVFGAVCLAVIALALPGYAQESTAVAPGQAAALEQRGETLGQERSGPQKALQESPDAAMARRLQSLEEQMVEVRQGVARLLDLVGPAAQARVSPQVEERLGRLEQQNQEDHRAIWDLYDRLQRLEQNLTQTRNELNQRIGALSDANAALRQQLSQNQAQEEQRKKAAAGYPGINQIVIDKDGRRYIQYQQ